MFYIINFFPNFDVKSIIFPNFGHGPFPKIAGKGPVYRLSILQENIHNLIMLKLFVYLHTWKQSPGYIFCHS